MDNAMGKGVNYTKLYDWRRHEMKDAVDDEDLPVCDVLDQ